MNRASEGLVSSQRGQNNNVLSGVTFEVTGPFRS